jgi:hypothetical protein
MSGAGGLLNNKKQSYVGVMFAASVVNNADPVQKGRVRIRIPLVFDGISDADLPWALPDRLTNQVDIPSVGTKVYVEFQDGKPHQAIYYSNVVSGSGVQAPFKTNYPNKWGLSDGTDYLAFDKSTHETDLVSTGKLNTTSTDDTTITSQKKVVLSSQQDTTITSQQNFNATAQIQLTLTAATSSNIVANASGIQITATLISLN